MVLKTLTKNPSLRYQNYECFKYEVALQYSTNIIFFYFLVLCDFFNDPSGIVK